MNYIKGFLINLQFFTTIPIKHQLPTDEDHLNNAVRTIPIMGLFLGILQIFLMYVLIEWTPLSILSITFFLWVMMIILTGGIHLDGWIDASDGYFSYREIDKRLEIMKDPRTGAFGVLSVIVLLSAKFMFIYEVLTKISSASYFLILLIPFLSRSLMGLLLINVKLAKEEGLAFHFKKSAKPSTSLFYLIWAAIVLSVITIFYIKMFLPTMILITVTMACYFLFHQKSVKWFGGISGDVLGASVEGVELALWMTVWLLHYSVMV